MNFGYFGKIFCQLIGEFGVSDSMESDKNAANEGIKNDQSNA